MLHWTLGKAVLNIILGPGSCMSPLKNHCSIYNGGVGHEPSIGIGDE